MSHVRKKILIAASKKNCENYARAVAASGCIPLALPKNILNFPIQGKEQASHWDALLLPGGDDVNPRLYHQKNTHSHGIDDPLDEIQLRLIHAFVKAKKPILGICRGHQILNVYFGGTLNQHIPTWKHHKRPGELYTIPGSTDTRHTTTLIPDCFLEKIYQASNIITNSCHHQAIHHLGKNLRPIQFSDDGIIEALIHTSLPIISVQWHPERMAFDFYRKDTADGALLFSYFFTAYCG